MKMNLKVVLVYSLFIESKMIKYMLLREYEMLLFSLILIQVLFRFMMYFQLLI